MSADSPVALGGDAVVQADVVQLAVDDRETAGCEDGVALFAAFDE